MSNVPVIVFKEIFILQRDKEKIETARKFSGIAKHNNERDNINDFSDVHLGKRSHTNRNFCDIFALKNIRPGWHFPDESKCEVSHWGTWKKCNCKIAKRVSFGFKCLAFPRVIGGTLRCELVRWRRLAGAARCSGNCQIANAARTQERGCFREAGRSVERAEIGVDRGPIHISQQLEF